MKQYVTLGDTVYFWFAGNDTAGSGGDGASPAADVRLAGAAVDAAPVLSPVPSLLTHANYPNGCFEIAVVATSGNGFAANQTYAVFSTLAIDGQNPTGFVGSFDLKPVLADAADSVWDALLKGSTYNVPTSAGRRLREIAAFAIHSGTAQAGNSHSITLAVNADVNSGVYNRNLIVLVGGTGVGQTRTIVDYDGASKIVVIDRDWRVSPNNTTEYQIVPDDTPLTVDHGKVQAATENTVTIRDYAADEDNAYLCNIIAIITGKGRGQARLVGAYNGTTKVVTLCGDNWIETPDTSSIYVMIPYGVSCTSCFDANAKTQIKSECDDALIDYDPPTRTEATADKDEIIVEVIAGLAALNDVTVAEIIAGISDGSYDLQEMLRLVFAACCGKSSGGGTPILRFRDSADGKDRIEATVDSNGNRTGVILDGS